MKGFTLSEAELDMLRNVHRQTKNKRAADRIKAVYSLAIGHSVSQVASILMIDEQTLRHYQACYEQGGVSALSKSNYKGRTCRLSSEQLATLENKLDNQICLTTKAIIAHVKQVFNVIYTESGMRDLLHRMGYEYKKPKLVPGTPDIEAQEEFAAVYEDFMLTKPADAEVLFLDAVHPEHNTMAAYGWIKRGQTRELKTNSGRGRLNLHGAINAETYQMTLIESKTVNAESTIELLTAIEKAYPFAKSIHIILDNARYHYSKSVKAFIANSRINLVFLPSYSPNLNLIERVWKFFKKNILYNQYYENIHDFRKACIRFFSRFSDYHYQVDKFMSADFHIAY